MKKLLYLFLTCLFLVGCRGNRYYLDKVESLWGVDYDSVQYYLLKVDSTSLDSNEWIDYQYYRMMASNGYLMSMTSKRLDSIIGIMKQHYPKGHKRAFRSRQIEWVYYYNRQDVPHKTDSLIDALRHFALSRNDSARWYIYKSQIKKRLGESDSALYYIKEAMKFRLWGERYAYEQQSFIHRMKEQPDSALAYCIKAMELDTTMNIFSLNRQILDMLVELKDKRKALGYLKEVRKRMKRSDIPYYHLMKGDYWLAMHESDSAMRHYRIATETGNAFMAMQAYERMGLIAESRLTDEETFRMYHNAQRVWNDIYLSLESKRSIQDFEALQMKNQLSELKVERQKHIIVILGLTLLVLALTGGFVLYLNHRERVIERNRLIQENVMMKQQEELSSLREKQALQREKDARMREELFKRMNVFNKLSDTEKKKHIQLSDTDWKEIQLMLDSGYDDFTNKLRKRFPTLSEKDINFCCLVKINMSIQSLTDIYCISKNSVSRRKLRLKEKLGINKEDSLAKFLRQFS